MQATKKKTLKLNMRSVDFTLNKCQTSEAFDNRSYGMFLNEHSQDAEIPLVGAGFAVVPNRRGGVRGIASYGLALSLDLRGFANDSTKLHRAHVAKTVTNH